MTVSRSSLCTQCLAAFVFLADSLFNLQAAEQIVYDNTKTPLNYRISEPLEFGSELILGGTARSLTEVAFEYYGEFAQTGDEMCKVRIYSNETPYDIFRNEPTKLLYESGYFLIRPGSNSVRLDGFNAPLRDTVTMTIEPRGLAAGEKMSLLLYNPPVIGRSFNEFWRRTVDGSWQAVIYPFTDPSLKAKAAIRLTAEDTVQVTTPKVVPGKSVAFGINGMAGKKYVVEASSDMKAWNILETKTIGGSHANFTRNLPTTQKQQFYRVRIQP